MVQEQKREGYAGRVPSLPPNPPHTTRVPQGLFPEGPRGFSLRVGGVWGVGCEGRRNDGHEIRIPKFFTSPFPPPAPSRSVAVLLNSSHGRDPCLPIGFSASLKKVRRAHIVLPMVITFDHPNPPKPSYGIARNFVFEFPKLPVGRANPLGEGGGHKQIPRFQGNHAPPPISLRHVLKS